MTRILVGADPELFLFRNGHVISAHNLLQGTKKSPFAVPGGAVQVDGTAAEFNIDPVDNADDFIKNIDGVRNTMIKIIRKNDRSMGGSGLGLRLKAIPSVQYAPEQWAEIPLAAKELGCDPDFNAYTGAANPRPEPVREGFRTGGGHIHIGWTTGADINDPSHMQDCRLVVRLLDHLLYKHSTLWDKDTTRMSLYGRPGAFRPKPYGVEYRVLSNAWVKSPRITRVVFENAVFAITLVNDHPVVAEYYDKYPYTSYSPLIPYRVAKIVDPPYSPFNYGGF